MKNDVTQTKDTAETKNLTVDAAAAAGTGNKAYAETSQVLALSHDNNLIIYVFGFTTGAGGKILVKLLPFMIYPPEFAAFEEVGNTGITGIGLDRVITQAAYFFPNMGSFEEILFADSKGRRSISVIRIQESQAELSSEGDTKPGEWSAAQDFRTTPPTLRVNGLPIMPTPGFQLTLCRAEPQGINPRILILNLKSEPPTGIVPEVLTPTPVAYEEQNEQEYDSLTIEPEGINITVEKVQ